MLPIGDDVERDSLPLAGLGLVILNLLVFLYMFRLDWDFHAQHPCDLSPHCNAELSATAIEEYIEHQEWVASNLPSSGFIEQFGLSSQTVRGGEYHRLLTHMFVHVDFEHFFFNMLMLWAFMWTLEAYMGPAGFTALYLGAGLLSALANVAMKPEDAQIAVGASAAISGVLGAYCARFGPATNIHVLVIFLYRFFRFKLPAAVFAILWLLSQWHGAVLSGDSSVGWFAHGAGFFAGLALLYVLGSDGKMIVQDADGVKRIVDAGSRQTAADLSDISSPAKDAGAATARAATADATGISAAALPETAEPSGPEHCVYCGTELAESAKIAQGLYRCPKTGCGRMHISSSKLPALTKAEPVEPWMRKKSAARR